MNCPKCGGLLIPICYGRPSKEGSEKIARGELYLGGCGMEYPNAPTHSCQNFPECSIQVLDYNSDLWKSRDAMRRSLAAKRAGR